MLTIVDTTASMLQALTDCPNLNGARSTTTLPERHATTGYLDNVQADSLYLLPAMSAWLYSPWVDISTISPASMSLASIWLKNCLLNHQPCRESRRVEQLPTRVIDVSDPQNPRLNGNRNCSEEYLTLSYKWGKGRQYLTTTLNLEAHKKLIPLSRMPGTFKDAVYVTYMLGFQWLWIDALCIIQDSTEDQEREMGVMDNIFRCSTLTLFAAAANSVDDGLSVMRDPRWVKPCLLNLKTTLDGQTLEASTYITADGHDRPEDPLRTRGWVLQEEVLSSRGLVFEGNELTWRCICGTASESRPNAQGKIDHYRELGTRGYDKYRSYGSGHDGFDLLRVWLQQKNPVPDRTPWQRDTHFDHWYSLVERYSQRRLTHSADILPALSGLASAMARMHQITYVAGLWKEDLQVGLAWYTAEGQHFVGGNLPADSATQDLPHLPAWSWASQWGKLIKFRGWEDNNKLMAHEGVVLRYDPNEKPATGLHPFGKVWQKSLLLRGRVKMATVVHNSQRIAWDRYNDSIDGVYNEDARYDYLRNIADPTSRDNIGQIAFDSDPKIFPVSLVHCLLCTVREKYGQWHLTCIAMVPTNETWEEFRRVGLVFLRDEDWFGSMMEWDPHSSQHEPNFEHKRDVGYNTTIRLARLVSSY